MAEHRGRLAVVHSNQSPMRDIKFRELPHPQVFEKLWGTNELLSSFDSINCLPPSSATGVPNDQTSWLHADQAPLRRGFFCIQVGCSTWRNSCHGMLP